MAKEYSIKLANGMVISDLTLNGNTFISEQAVDESIFKNNMAPVTIMFNDYEEIHEKMDLLFCRKKEDSNLYEFFLYDITDQSLILSKGIALLANKVLSDEEASEAYYLFEKWDPNSHAYKKDDKLQYKDTLYKVIQDHTSQADWTPDTAVSLYLRIADPTQEWPEWIQPVGDQGMYSKGDKVSYNGKHWTSDIDNNVWVPGEYGWTEVPTE